MRFSVWMIASVVLSLVVACESAPATEDASAEADASEPLDQGVADGAALDASGADGAEPSDGGQSDGGITGSDGSAGDGAAGQDASDGAVLDASGPPDTGVDAGPGEWTFSAYDLDGRLLGRYDEDGNPLEELVYVDGRLVSVVRAEVAHAVGTDHLGAPRTVTSSAGVELWRWSSEPYGTGAPEEDPDGDGQPFVFDERYPGQRYDAVTGLFANFHRNYDPMTGRYVEVDPLGLAGGANLYAYAAGDPLGAIDPTGLSTINLLPSSNRGFFGTTVPHPPYYAELSFEAPPGTIVVSAHGDGDFVYAYGNGVYGENKVALDAAKVARMIKDQPDYTRDTTVVISACWTGQNGGLAEQLSKILPNRILAPMDMTSTNPLTGKTSVADNPLGDQYRVFNGDPGVKLQGEDFRFVPATRSDPLSKAVDGLVRQVRGFIGR